METTIYGPGSWLCLHLMALAATDDRRKQSFLDFLDLLKTSYPCHKCRQHMTAYFTAYPVQAHWNEDQGFFRWSVKFHNAVNQRLGKPLITYEQALAIYTGQNQVCTAGCEAEESVRDWRQDQSRHKQMPRTYYIPRYRGHNY